MLKLESIHQAYNGTEILAGIDLEVCPGDFIAILGPNGAGKTTLLKTAAGLLAPSAGRALLNDRPILDYPRREVAQNLSLLPQFSATGFGFSMSVWDCVSMGRYPYVRNLGRFAKRDREAIDAAIERAGIGHLVQRQFSTLSGGEQRRVLIARCIAQDAPVLLLDEPIANLDLRYQAEIYRLLAELAAGGHAVVACEHQINLASAFASRLILLDDGKVVADGTPDEVIDEGLLRQVYRTEVVVTTNPVTGAREVAHRLEGVK